MKIVHGFTISLFAAGVCSFYPTAVRAACTLAQPPNMVLGIYTGAQSNAGSTNLVVDCTAGSANYVIAMSGGVSGNTTARTLRMGTATLNYALFRDAARTQNWGNAAGTDTYAGNGATPNVSIPVYPRLTANQNVAPGSYIDTIMTGTKQFTVTAFVVPSCTLSTSALAFGTYRGLALDGSSTVSVSCTSTTPYSVGLSAGTSSGATVSTRAMTSGSARLSYQLFRDAARSQNWGSTAGTDTVSGSGSGSVQSITVWGRVPSGQYTSPGIYSDTIIATITY